MITHSSDKIRSTKGGGHAREHAHSFHAMHTEDVLSEPGLKHLGEGQARSEHRLGHVARLDDDGLLLALEPECEDAARTSAGSLVMVPLSSTGQAYSA